MKIVKHLIKQINPLNRVSRILSNKSKKSFFSLPLDKSYSMMKYSLLKPYETKKACVLVKPYL